MIIIFSLLCFFPLTHSASPVRPPCNPPQHALVTPTSGSFHLFPLPRNSSPENLHGLHIIFSIFVQTSPSQCGFPRPTHFKLQYPLSYFLSSFLFYFSPECLFTSYIIYLSGFSPRKWIPRLDLGVWFVSDKSPSPRTMVMHGHHWVLVTQWSLGGKGELRVFSKVCEGERD